MFLIYQNKFTAVKKILFKLFHAVKENEFTLKII